jgi:hypothetical protein
VAFPELACAVPFYGRQPKAEDVLYARHIFRFRLPAIKGHRAGQFRKSHRRRIGYAAAMR